MKEMRNGLRGYNPKHATQKKVLEFLIPMARDGKGYMKIFKDEDNKNNLDEYINKSAYWHKKSTYLGPPMGKTTKWVFAQNHDMKAIICLFRGWFIVCTKSSHDNIMNHIEGKPMVIRNQMPTGVSLDVELPKSEDSNLEQVYKIVELLIAVPDAH